MDRPWAETDPEQLVAPGHAAGDVLEAWNWRVLERSHGRLLIEVDLPESLKNPQGQLFGGFTPTYVDFVSIFTMNSHDPGTAPPEQSWVTTINMRCDYFEPIMGPTFTILGEVVNRRGKTALVSTKFFVGTDPGDETMAAHAITTLRQLDIAAPDMAAPPT
jgi:acyl-coenzyme A thioesterase PaaI-like protein